MKKNASSSLCYKIEGNLFLSNQLELAFIGKNQRQQAQSYRLSPGITLKEEYSRAFQIGKASWKIFFQACERKDLSEQDQRERTAAFAKHLLGDVLGYRLIATDGIDCAQRHYPIAFEAQGTQEPALSLPVALTSWGNLLDTAIPELVITGSGHSKKSAFSLVQELLNASEAYRWGFAFNGITLRLVRESMSLTRPSFLEFNLQEIFANDDYAQFMHLWMVLHVSRADLVDGLTAWDLWILEGQEAGQPAREELSISIRAALLELGNGFLQEPSNDKLRALLDSGKLSAKDYTHELLRVMYRFLFVFCLEERDLLHVKEDTPENRLARARYKRGYALHRFREMSRKTRFQTDHTDAWECTCIVFSALEKGLPALALPALGGLFNHSQCPHLSQAKLSNTTFFRVMYQMRWATINDVFSAIDYRNMGPEELGSIYESLLELVPWVDVDSRLFGFMSGAETSSERKKTGSYYTPDAFVQLLIGSALDPVIDKRLKNANGKPESTLLGLRVIDPACGSGHFLLAAARRIAEKLALVRSADGDVTPENYRLALRKVIARCIYGVDLNPLAVELARMALWLEGYAEGMPLSFLDHHLKVGNALIGVFDLNDLKKGIYKDAFKPLGFDDKAVCAELSKRNTQGLKQLKSMSGEDSLMDDMFLSSETSLLSQIEAMTVRDLAGERSKEALYQKHLSSLASNHIKQTCDLQIGAYLCDKTPETKDRVPTSELLARAIFDRENMGTTGAKAIDLAAEACAQAHAFHWPLEFPHVFAQGGFDCVLGNPPWEKAKVEDVKWFAKRRPKIAHAASQAERKKMIDALKKGQFTSKYQDAPWSESLAQDDKALYADYMAAKKNAAAGFTLGHLNKEDGGRFPLTGTGDTNLFAYFSELALQLRKADGTVGIVVPVGIITDDATKAFSQHILDGHTQSIYHFNNTEKLFPIHSSYSFVLLTLRDSDEMHCVFYATRMEHLNDPLRHIVFGKDDLKLMNPNTRTCVLPRSSKDLELCLKLYRAAPVLLNECDSLHGNPWGIRFMTMFHMANDSHLFHAQYQDGFVPLYEGKLFHQFDHRWATYDDVNKKGECVTRDVREDEKKNFAYCIKPQWWLDPNDKDVQNRFVDTDSHVTWWQEPWMFAFRDITSPTNERTAIATVLPSNVGAAHTSVLFFPLSRKNHPKQCSCLLANINSFLVDYVCRIKQSGTHLSYFIFKQLPVLPPDAFTDDDVDYIASRVATLTRTSDDISHVWLTEYPSNTFQDPEERLQLRAELDAYFAHLYGLNRDELRYILDPSDVMGKDFPSTTFPGLKNKEICLYGEFLTRRLVLKAYDDLAQTERFAHNSRH